MLRVCAPRCGASPPQSETTLRSDSSQSWARRVAARALWTRLEQARTPLVCTAALSAHQFRRARYHVPLAEIQAEALQVALLMQGRPAHPAAQEEAIAALRVHDSNPKVAGFLQYWSTLGLVAGVYAPGAGDEVQTAFVDWYRGPPGQARYMPSLAELRTPSGLDAFVLQGWMPASPLIRRDRLVTALGSCFADEIRIWLRARGYRVNSDFRTGSSYPYLEDSTTPLLQCSAGLVNVRNNVCMYVCIMYVCMHVCMYVCVYVRMQCSAGLVNVRNEGFALAPPCLAPACFCPSACVLYVCLSSECPCAHAAPRRGDVMCCQPSLESQPSHPTLALTLTLPLPLTLALART